MRDGWTDPSAAQHNTKGERMTGPDAVLTGGGTIYLLEPLSESAASWIAEFVAGETSWFGNALCIEHRYVEDVVTAMRADGLDVQIFYYGVGWETGRERETEAIAALNGGGK